MRHDETILVVGDDDSFRTHVRAVLGSAGFAVLGARDGEQHFSSSPRAENQTARDQRRLSESLISTLARSAERMQSSQNQSATGKWLQAVRDLLGGEANAQETRLSGRK
jgi:DNA-binding NtrC family response regulator